LQDPVLPPPAGRAGIARRVARACRAPLHASRCR
jgi:hypothetical protein